MVDVYISITVITIVLLFFRVQNKKKILDQENFDKGSEPWANQRPKPFAFLLCISFEIMYQKSSEMFFHWSFGILFWCCTSFLCFVHFMSLFKKHSYCFSIFRRPLICLQYFALFFSHSYNLYSLFSDSSLSLSDGISITIVCFTIYSNVLHLLLELTWEICFVRNFLMWRE